MKPILILKAGSTQQNIKNQFGDFEDWIISEMGIHGDETIIHDIQNNLQIPDIENFAGVVITGSHSMVTDNTEWILNSADWLLNATSTNTLILGICFGHQLIAHALGGKVDFNPKGREIGARIITLTSIAASYSLFKNLPQSFTVLESHQQSVFGLPPAAKVLAYNDHDANQAFVIDNHIWGTQFHPEFDAPIMHAYIEAQRPDLHKEGFNISNLISDLDHFRKQESILKQFIQIVKDTC